jgi:hypothetical protein
LDLDKPDLAFKIAKKGLDIYQRETDETYYTFEHFLAKSGRGAGWHQFSGLSTPILSWFSAYYKPGTVTTGFEIWIKDQEFNLDNSSYKATLVFDGSTTPHKKCILVCLNPKYTYTAKFDGKEIPFTSPFDGLLSLSLPISSEGKLEIFTK